MKNDTVEVVIRIPKEQYNNILNKGQVIALSGYEKMIGKGTVLPKGHGDLKDANYMKREGIINRGNYNSIKGVREWIDEAPTVIEADRDGDADG